MDQNKTFAFLERIASNLEAISANGGSIDIATGDGTVTGLSARQIITRSSSVITTLTGVGPAVNGVVPTINFLTSDYLNISGKTIEANTMYRVQNGYRITACGVTGALVAYE